jgi:hypothetical protein
MEPIMKTLLSIAITALLLSANAIAASTIVTQDNFPQAYTNMRLGALLQTTGIDFSDGYDQSKAFGNSESGQTAYMNYVGVAGGWGGAMVVDNIYQTSGYFSADAPLRPW